MSNILSFLKDLLSLPKKLALLFITLYQRTLSPDHGLLKSLYPGGYCKFCPSCSSYCYLSVQKYGVIKGLPKGIGRVLRCHPWSKGGYDPIK
ncbi:membrane protein insertion efficiency factor YidD [Patescibacteria group bacterium]|nr:membrane protein insertion efficiency factor YidD [Patescibacteria group bacterium]